MSRIMSFSAHHAALLCSIVFATQLSGCARTPAPRPEVGVSARASNNGPILMPATRNSAEPVSLAEEEELHGIHPLAHTKPSVYSTGANNQSYGFLPLSR